VLGTAVAGAEPVGAPNAAFALIAANANASAASRLERLLFMPEFLSRRTLLQCSKRRAKIRVPGTSKLPKSATKRLRSCSGKATMNDDFRV
jgi:hypothetical protein